MSMSTVTRKRAAIPTDIHKTRRAALGALVAAGGLAIPAIGSIAAPIADPIFVAIARHKAAYDAALTSSFALDDLINNPRGREVTDADWEVYERARADEDAAFDDLLACTPRTSAGLRAIVAHLIYLDDGRLSEKMRRLLTLLFPPEARPA